MKCHRSACNGLVHQFLDIEAMVDDSEEDEEAEGGASPGVLPGAFIEDDSTNNSGQAHDSAWRLKPVDNPSREGGWHDFVGSLEKRYASGSKMSQHIVKNNYHHERLPLNPALVSCIENMAGLNCYPFWRVRCKVRLSFPSSSRFPIHTPCLGRLGTSPSFVFMPDDSATTRDAICLHTRLDKIMSVLGGNHEQSSASSS